MKESDVRFMATKGVFRRKILHGTVEETHISWVILTKEFAFKIKKPLKLSFLDFSTLRLRKEYCDREVKLNNRFTDIYIGVVPVRFFENKWIIGGEKGRIVDFAVHMKRMAISKRMDNMLRLGKVKEENIHALAEEIAAFHQKAEIIYTPFSLSVARKTFNDIKGIRKAVSSYLGDDYGVLIDRAIQWSDAMLKSHAHRFRARIAIGFSRDVHGDLHSGNIFLYKKPVLFDCIEFNDAYRQIDVLYEIAYLCMDLEAFGESHLASVFLSAYSSLFDYLQVKEDHAIFNYYKCLRANIRAKVHAMSLMQAETEEEVEWHTGETRKYLELMKAYITK